LCNCHLIQYFLLLLLLLVFFSGLGQPPFNAVRDYNDLILRLERKEAVANIL
jgi:hypothetical protein